MTRPFDQAWRVLKMDFGELDMVLREEGEEAALQWLAERGVTGENAKSILQPPPRPEFYPREQELTTPPMPNPQQRQEEQDARGQPYGQGV